MHVHIPARAGNRRHMLNRRRGCGFAFSISFEHGERIEDWTLARTTPTMDMYSVLAIWLKPAHLHLHGQRLPRQAQVRASARVFVRAIRGSLQRQLHCLIAAQRRIRVDDIATRNGQELICGFLTGAIMHVQVETFGGNTIGEIDVCDGLGDAVRVSYQLGQGIEYLALTSTHAFMNMIGMDAIGSQTSHIYLNG